MAEIALLDDGGEIDFVPQLRIFIAVVVTGLETVTSIEVEFPHILAHRITPNATACTIVDVIVNDSVINHGAFPQIITSAVSTSAGRIGNILRIDLGLASRDQLIDRNTVEHIAGLRHFRL